MGAPVRSYGGKGSSSSKSSSKPAPAGLYASGAYISTPSRSTRKGGKTNAMNELFSCLDDIGHKKENLDSAKKDYDKAEEELNAAVDAFNRKIDKHPSRDSFRDLLSEILSDEDRSEDYDR